MYCPLPVSGARCLGSHPSKEKYRMSTVSSTLPHWDMSVVYPGLESQEFAHGFSRVVQDVDELTHLFDVHHIMESPSTPLNSETIHAFELVIERYNAVLEAISTLNVY